jgi:hypothetical protein
LPDVEHALPDVEHALPDVEHPLLENTPMHPSPHLLIGHPTDRPSSLLDRFLTAS